MPEKQSIKRAQRAQHEGKSPSTQAGEFVCEEIHHIGEGEHGARSTKQAIAIGFSKARRAGVNLAPSRKSKISESTRRNAERDYQAGHRRKSPRSRRRSQARERSLKRESHNAASRKALQKQTRSAARRRSQTARSNAARQAARAKGHHGRFVAAQKAARTVHDESRADIWSCLMARGITISSMARCGESSPDCLVLHQSALSVSPHFFPCESVRHTGPSNCYGDRITIRLL